MTILIKNGIIIDGTGENSFAGDIFIKEEKITAIGNLQENTADTIINASGMYVAPGFIDITNHSDTHGTLFLEPSQESMLMQGITSIFGGSCGSSLAPLVKAGEAGEIMQKWVNTSGINTSWLSMQEYLDELEHHSIGVNYGTLVGQGTLRRSTLQDSAKPASEEKIKEMSFLLRKALEEGAFGLSFGLGFSHGQAASQVELISLARVIKEYNRLVTIHIRDEGRDILPSINEIIHIARESEAHVQISHFKALGKEAWSSLSQVYKLIRSARKENISISATAFPYTRTGSLLYALLPPWAREGGKNNVLKRIINAEVRTRLISSIKELTLHYEKIIIQYAKNTKAISGKSLKAISADWTISPEEAMLDILTANDLSVTIFGDAINEKNIESIYLEPYALFSTDGAGRTLSIEFLEKDLEHPRSFGASARFLQLLVKEKNLLSWEHAVQKMTGSCAKTLGIADRGILKKDMYADICIFSPEEITDTATFEDPYHAPRGIRWVLINGSVAVENGLYSGGLFGKILRA